MRILGIETSCDETSVAIVEKTDDGLRVLKHATASQIALHEQYGGVVPEVAARKHTEAIIPLIESEVGRELLSSIDGIAVASGPGLITSLMIGTQTAKTLSWALHKPLIGVNHLKAHIYANWISHPELSGRGSEQYFPSLALVVSGGHTLYVLMTSHGELEILGGTVDDAAGEAFDKVAKMLELGYPGGPKISELAVSGNPQAIDFPRPMQHTDGYQVSFSGLKTAVRYYLEQKKRISKKELPDIAASFQQAVVDVLMSKLISAVDEYSPHSIQVVGGVSANTQLRDAVQRYAKDSVPVFIPELSLTGDNAAMIAAAGIFHPTASTKEWKTLVSNAQQSIV